MKYPTTIVVNDKDPRMVEGSEITLGDECLVIHSVERLTENTWELEVTAPCAPKKRGMVKILGKIMLLLPKR